MYDGNGHANIILLLELARQHQIRAAKLAVVVSRVFAHSPPFNQMVSFVPASCRSQKRLGSWQTGLGVEQPI